jgi:endoglucanase
MKLDNLLIEKLCNEDGIAGHEKAVRKIMETNLVEYVDEISYDNLGSLIARKKGTGPKVMLAAHLDEVGFIVKRIDDNGFIYFQTVGGWWGQVLLAQRVVITNAMGQKFNGVIGSKPPHVLPIDARNKPVEIKDMFIDLGVKDKEEVTKLGIKIGDMITPDSKFSEMNNPDYMIAKAFDNRIGVYVVCEVMKQLKDKKVNADVYAVGTVQEEIGLRGATTAANLINPDLSFSVDTTIAGDTPKLTEDEAVCRLGDGAVVTVMDGTTMGHVSLREYMLEIANKHDIKTQLDFMIGGGTDAGRMHLAHDGSPAMSLAVCTRYIHSHASVIHKDDVEALINLIVKFIETINDDDYQEILK